MAVERPQRAPIFPLPEGFPCPKGEELEVCSVLLPGGVDFADVDLLKSIQPALAPLAPMFNMVEAIVAVKDCVVAATQMPDPTDLIACIPGLTAAINKLLALLPQTSVPKMALDLIDCIIRELERLNLFVLGLLNQLERITATLERAAELDDPQLAAFAVCASERLSAQLDDEMKGLIVLGRILGTLSAFLGLIGIPSDLVPDFETITGADLVDVQEIIQSAIDSLTSLREIIPA